jgi:hypothetical protein
VRRARALFALLAFGLLAATADGGAAWAKGKGKKRQRATPSASSDKDGRRHLKKANALAAKDNCEAAIDEYTLAFEKLSDPVVLLARAECRRRVGQNTEALADYHAYLDLMPDVPHRADIQAKIAALEALPSRAGAGKEARPPKGGPAATPEPVAPVAKESPPRERSHPPAAPPPAVAAPRAPPAVAPPPPVAPPPTVVPPPPPIAALPAAPEPSPAVEPAPPTITLVQPAAAGPAPRSSGGRAWLWVTIAAVVAGGAVAGGYLYFKPSDPAPPMTKLGNYHF